MVGIIVAGSRLIVNEGLIKRAMLDGLKEFDIDLEDPIDFNNIVIITGGAEGVDSIANKVAKEWGLKTKVMNADWDRYGKRAGYLRNKRMERHADYLIAVWDCTSRGTKMMIYIMKSAGKEFFVVEV